MSDYVEDQSGSLIQKLLNDGIRQSQQNQATLHLMMQLDYDREEAGEIQDMRGKNSSFRPGGGNGPSGRPDYWSSLWGRMLITQQDKLEVFNSEESKVFRRRFRIPYPVFVSIVDSARAKFPEKRSAANAQPVPLELKILGVLRVLGRSTVFDGINELSGIGVSTFHSFFHRFCEWFGSEIYRDWVSMPKSEDEIAAITAAYALVGLPGAVGSMDVVHLAWGMCPAGLANLATGKEGYPSVAYNVIADHKCRILATLPGVYGSLNDKTIVRFDRFVEDVRSNPLFTESRFQVRTDAGMEMVEGLWLLVDGGYHKWRALQSASNVINYPQYAAWRQTMESTRKDIERTFGRLKNRFRI